MDVRGKFVLCFRGTPDADDKRFQRHDEHRARMRNARDKGALGLIYIYPEVQANPNGERLENFLPAMISEADGRPSLRGQERSRRPDLKKDLRTYGVPITFAIDARIDFAVEARHFAGGHRLQRRRLSPGQRPAAAGRVRLVLGAHLDGCGRHLGILFAGADDNASGSAVVMEVARAFAVSGLRPRRTLVFVLFGGEEMGLLGSVHFAARPACAAQEDRRHVQPGHGGRGRPGLRPVQRGTPELQQAIEKADGFLGILEGTGTIREVGCAVPISPPSFCRAFPAPPSMPTAPTCTTMPPATPFSASIPTSWPPSPG